MLVTPASDVVSLPLRGAWIEIIVDETRNGMVCRSPCGERGLKFREAGLAIVDHEVALHAGSVD